MKALRNISKALMAIGFTIMLGTAGRDDYTMAIHEPMPFKTVLLMGAVGVGLFLTGFAVLSEISNKERR